MAENWVARQRVDMARGSIDPRRWVNLLLRAGDEKSIDWIVEVYDDGAPADLTGCNAAAYFTRSDGVAVRCAGEISGNVVTVTFTRSCANAPGELPGHLRLGWADGPSLMLAEGVFFVGEPISDDPIQDGDAVPSIEQLMAEIEDMETAAGEARAAAAVAATAAERAEEAAGDVTESDNYAKQSKSWAVGGTGLRPDEATDNSRYWAQQAQASASAAAQDAQAANTDAGRAVTAATLAAQSATGAANAASAAQGFAADASESESVATQSATDAAAAATRAETAAQGVEDARDQAAASATAAAGSAAGAAQGAQDAAGSATAAAGSATAAGASEAAAAASEAAAKASEIEAARIAASLPPDYSALAEYVREMSPAATVGPAASVSVADAAPLTPDALKWMIEPAQAGTGDPSPDNVRPITGCTGMTGVRCGKNLFNIADIAPSQYVTVSGTTFTKGYTGYYYDLLNGTEGDTAIATQKMLLKAGAYTLSGTYTSATGSIRMYTVDSVGVVSTTFIAYLDNSRTSMSFTLDADTYVTFRYRNREEATVTNLQIELGSATAYEPYTGDTFPITFPTEAGTVYGGYVDAVNGKLVVDKAMVDLGTLTWGYNSTGDSTTGGNPYFYVSTVEGMKNAFANCDLEMFKFINYGRSVMRTNEPVACHLNSNNPGIGVRWDAVTSLTDFVSAVTGSKLVYELATPIEYDIDPVTLELLRSNNTLWCDTGDTEMTYRQDLATIIAESTRATRSMIAGIEDGTTATRAYAAGDLLIIVDKLYKAAAPIASGAAFTPGTNVTETTVAEQLLLLANA